MSVFSIGGTTPTGASAVAGSSSTTSGSANSAQGMQNAFLQLLVAQLQYQNPLQPMSNTQFVTQLAQMQTLSVLESIKSDLNKLVADQASSTSSGTASGTALSKG